MSQKVVFLTFRAGDSLTPGLDNTRLFMSITAGAGTRSKVFSLHYQAFTTVLQLLTIDSQLNAGCLLPLGTTLPAACVLAND